MINDDIYNSTSSSTSLSKELFSLAVRIYEVFKKASSSTEKKSFLEIYFLSLTKNVSWSFPSDLTKINTEIRGATGVNSPSISTQACNISILSITYVPIQDSCFSIFALLELSDVLALASQGFHNHQAFFLCGILAKRTCKYLWKTRVCSSVHMQLGSTTKRKNKMD